MELSPDTEEVLNFLDLVTGENLRKRNDLGTILEVLAKGNKANLANDLIFYGSALWNTFKISKRNQENVESEKIRAELPQLFTKISDMLTEISGYLSGKDQIHFDKVYLQSTSGCQRNIIDLCFDLNELKKVQIVLKNKPNRRAT